MTTSSFSSASASASAAAYFEVTTGGGATGATTTGAATPGGEGGGITFPFSGGRGGFSIPGLGGFTLPGFGGSSIIPGFGGSSGGPAPFNGFLNPTNLMGWLGGGSGGSGDNGTGMAQLGMLGMIGQMLGMQGGLLGRIAGGMGRMEDMMQNQNKLLGGIARLLGNQNRLLERIANNTQGTNERLDQLAERQEGTDRRLDRLTRGLRDLRNLLRDRLPRPRSAEETTREQQDQARRLMDKVSTQAEAITDSRSMNKDDVKKLSRTLIDAYKKLPSLNDEQKRRLDALKDRLEVAESESEVNNILKEIIGFAKDNGNVDSLPAEQKEALDRLLLDLEDGDPDVILGGNEDQPGQRNAFKALANILR